MAVSSHILKRITASLHSLSAQMILSFILLVFLTGIAAGLPALWLMHDQLNRQAWAQVEQAGLAARALYVVRQKEVINLARLTAQRPTLQRLLVLQDFSALPPYLETLRRGADIDLILVCDDKQQSVVQAGSVTIPNLCLVNQASRLYVANVETGPQAWLLAAHPFEADSIDVAAGSVEGTVIIAQVLNDNFAVQMQAQTGLEHTLLLNGQPLASSFQSGRNLFPPAASQAVAGTPGLVEQNRRIFTLDDRPYYAMWLSLEEPGLVAEIALPVAHIFAAQERLRWTLAGAILGIIVIGAILSTILARHISYPLAHLTLAATRLSHGDLTTPVAIETQVREVALVAWALEGARIDLKLSLNELQREKDWTDHLLQAIVEGIITLDNQGRITFFSRGAERITGWSRDQVLGRLCDEIFFPVDTVEPFSQLIPPPDGRQKIAVEVLDGRQIILSITRARLLPTAGGNARTALVFRDLSEEEAVHRLLGHFLANIAHEFRTPLSALAASIELLREEAADLSTAELQELLTSLHLGTLGLQTLIDNLLEGASIEAGRFRVSPRRADLTEIIGEATQTMQPLLDKRDQVLTLELPPQVPPVKADLRRTVQVLVNLISNASKYGPDQAEITICASLLPQARVKVTVADRGPGISAEFRRLLFHRFVHPDPVETRAQYGVGLGLSVVKAIVEAQGGQVGLEDRAGGGSIFWFTLPVWSET